MSSARAAPAMSRLPGAPSPSPFPSPPPSRSLPTTQLIRESSELRLSASKLNASAPPVPRLQPREPEPVVSRPGTATRRESTYIRRWANRTTAPPLSSGVPATDDAASVAVTSPTGGVTLSRATPPETVKLSRDSGAWSSQRARSTSRARSVKSRAPYRGSPSSSTPLPSMLPPGERSSACIWRAASVPASFTGPAAAPRRGNAGKLPRSPSNDTESAVTSA